MSHSITVYIIRVIKNYMHKVTHAIYMIGLSNSGSAKRSIGEQNKAKFRTDNNGAVSILYSGGNKGRYVHN